MTKPALFALALGVEPPPGMVILCDGASSVEMEAGFAASMALKPCDCALCMELAGFSRATIEADGWRQLEELARKP